MDAPRQPSTSATTVEVVRDNTTQEGSGAPSTEAVDYWNTLPSNNLTAPQTLTGRFPVLDVWPRVEGGRRPVKAVVGELVMVNCVAFREGHDSLGVDLVATDPQGRTVRTPMVPRDNGTDLWDGNFRPNTEGAWSFTIVAYSDIQIGRASCRERV